MLANFLNYNHLPVKILNACLSTRLHHTRSALDDTAVVAMNITTYYELI